MDNYTPKSKYSDEKYQAEIDRLAKLPPNPEGDDKPINPIGKDGKPRTGRIHVMYPERGRVVRYFEPEA